MRHICCTMILYIWYEMVLILRTQEKLLRTVSISFKKWGDKVSKQHIQSIIYDFFGWVIETLSPRKLTVDLLFRL